MPGRRWRPQIEEALGVAHLIVLFWCHHSSRSAEVRKEYESALLTGKDVLPVLLDATPLPKELNEFQWVDFRQFVGLGHRSFKRWLAIAATVSVLMVGFLFSFWYFGPSGAREPLPPSLPVPAPPVPASPLEWLWLPVIFTATVLALAIWLVRRVVRRYRIRKKMAATLQEELFRRGIGSV
jgi:TIR domain